jgi:hypothetical protein
LNKRNKTKAKIFVAEFKRNHRRERGIPPRGAPISLFVKIERRNYHGTQGKGCIH